MLGIPSGLSRIKKARIAILAGGISTSALLYGITAQSGPAAAVAAATALIAVTAVITNFIERSSRKGAINHLRDAIEPMAEGIAFFDAEDRAVAWNPRYSQLVDPAGALEPGIAFPDLLRANVRAGVHPEAAGREEEWLQQRLALRSRLGSDEHKNGDRWVRAERRRTRDGGLVTVVMDVTEFRWATEVLSQARDSAEAANRAKSEFLATVSHELRTPLNGVIGIAEVLARTKLDERQTEMVETIRSSGASLNSLVSDIIDLARLESGKINSVSTNYDVAAELETACRPYRLQAEKKGIVFAVDLESDAAGSVVGDPQRLRQILGNLLSNAVKFTDAGEIRIRVERPLAKGDMVRFVVEDSGIGFDEAFKENIFERFQQADGSNTRRHGGTGLGLAICKQAAGLMGGDLDCASTPGQGSTFTLTLELPRADAPQAAPAPVMIATPGAAANDLGHALRVLVVDDHPTNRRVVEMILDQVGAERVSVENGQLALEAYINDHFDVVLMDIQMPVMDGLTATQQIRLIEKNEARQHTPVIILSANALPEHVAAGKAAGANRHLGKPISAAALLDVIAEVAGEAAA